MEVKTLPRGLNVTTSQDVYEPKHEEKERRKKTTDRQTDKQKKGEPYLFRVGRKKSPGEGFEGSFGILAQNVLLH